MSAAAVSSDPFIDCYRAWIKEEGVLHRHSGRLPGLVHAHLRWLPVNASTGYGSFGP